VASLFLPKEPAGSPAPDAAAAVAATGPAYRVMVGVGPGDSAARLAGAGRALAGTRRPLDLVVVQPADLGESPVRYSEGGSQVGATLSGLVPLASIVGGPEITVTPLSFESTDMAEDLLQLADELNPDLLVVGVGRRGRGEAIARANRIARGAHRPTVVFYDPTGEGVYAHDDLPVVGSGTAAALAEQVAAGIGARTAADSPKGALALVIPMSEGWEAALAPARCPVFVVAEPAAVPAVPGA